MRECDRGGIAESFGGRAGAGGAGLGASPQGHKQSASNGDFRGRQAGWKFVSVSVEVRGMKGSWQVQRRILISVVWWKSVTYQTSTHHGFNPKFPSASVLNQGTI